MLVFSPLSVVTCCCRRAFSDFCENISTSNSLQAQLNDIKRDFQADLQRMEEEFRVQVNLQTSENARLQQQLTTLTGEKTSIHQQIIALQRRIEEIEEEIGHE